MTRLHYMLAVTSCKRLNLILQAVKGDIIPIRDIKNVHRNVHLNTWLR